MKDAACFAAAVNHVTPTDEHDEHPDIKTMKEGFTSCNLSELPLSFSNFTQDVSWSEQAFLPRQRIGRFHGSRVCPPGRGTCYGVEVRQ